MTDYPAPGEKRKKSKEIIFLATRRDLSGWSHGRRLLASGGESSETQNNCPQNK